MNACDPLDVEVAAMVAGNDAAFRVVYRSVHPALLRYLCVLVGQTDAEDVASETWAQAFRDLDRFAGGADDFRAWVTTIGRNRALDHLRRLRRRPAADLGPEDPMTLPDQADVEAAVVSLESTQGAMAMIADLPRDQAEAVVLRAILEFDARTAGQILGKRPGAVRSAAHRGLRTLARRLAEMDTLVMASTASVVQTNALVRVTLWLVPALRR